MIILSWIFFHWYFKRNLKNVTFFIFVFVHFCECLIWKGKKISLISLQIKTKWPKNWNYDRIPSEFQGYVFVTKHHKLQRFLIQFLMTLVILVIQMIGYQFVNVHGSKQKYLPSFLNMRIQEIKKSYRRTKYFCAHLLHYNCR